MKFKVGDKVKMIAEKPRYGNGGVNVGDIGEIKTAHSDRYYCDFSAMKSWSGIDSDLELVEDEVISEIKIDRLMVKCIDIGPYKSLTLGKVYEVSDEYDSMYEIIDDSAIKRSYYKYRFAIVTDEVDVPVVDTLEMIRLLKENTEKTAENSIGNHVRVGSYGDFIMDESDFYINIDILNAMWRITEPKVETITFTEAMKAYITSKTIQSQLTEKLYNISPFNIGLAIKDVSANEIDGLWVVKK